jgi:hypothetical protein
MEKADIRAVRRTIAQDVFPVLDSIGMLIDLKQGCDLEVRADILRVNGEGSYAALGWGEQGIKGLGYSVLLNSREIALVKHRFDQQMLSTFFWEPLPVTNRPMRCDLDGEHATADHGNCLTRKNCCCS